MTQGAKPERIEYLEQQIRYLNNELDACDVEDTVLIAGKGHESYQLVGDQRLPFSDAGEVQQVLAAMGGRA